MSRYRTLNNVFKNMTKIEIVRDCNICKVNIKALEERHLAKDEVVLIRPDWNASGIVTHYHILIFKIKDMDRVSKNLKASYKVWVEDD